MCAIDLRITWVSNYKSSNWINLSLPRSRFLSFRDQSSIKKMECAWGEQNTGEKWEGDERQGGGVAHGEPIMVTNFA